MGNYILDYRGVVMYNRDMKQTPTLTQVQDKLIAQELRAVRMHGNTITARSVIYGARTRAIKAIMDLGFNFEQARDAVKDAVDMVMLQLNAIEQPKHWSARW